MLKRNWKSTVLSLPGLLLAGTAFAQQPQAADPTKSMTPVTDAMLRDPPAADWLMWRRTYNGWGYSPLAEITPIEEFPPSALSTDQVTLLLVMFGPVACICRV